MRFQSRKNLEKVRSQPCFICGKPPPNDVDHVQTRGSGGDDKLSNLMALCRPHHSEKGQMGVRSFVTKYKLPITFEFGYPKRNDIKE